jgi:hypothetical protein
MNNDIPCSDVVPDMLSEHDRSDIKRIQEAYFKETGEDLMKVVDKLKRSISTQDGITIGGDGSSPEKKKLQALACWIVSMGVGYLVLEYIIGSNGIGLIQETQLPCTRLIDQVFDMLPIPGRVSCGQRSENFRNMVLWLLAILGGVLGMTDFNPIDPRWWFKFFGVSGQKGGKRRHTRRRAHKRSSNM